MKVYCTIHYAQVVGIRQHVVSLLAVAHIIRRPSTKQYKALCALEADRRWCLSGTPLQNRLSDLKSLITFLQISPYSDHDKFFNDFISTPLKNCELFGIQNLRLFLNTVFLRRSHTVLGLPPLQNEQHSISFDHAEIQAYDEIKLIAKKKIDSALKSKNCGKSYFTVLQLIMRLRLFCNIGVYLSKLKAISDNESSIFDLERANGASCADCGGEIDTLDFNQAVLTVCVHWLCSDCFTKFQISTAKEHICPLCGDELPEKSQTRQKKPTSKKRGKDLSSSAISIKTSELSSKLKHLLVRLEGDLEKR